MSQHNITKQIIRGALAGIAGAGAMQWFRVFWLMLVGKNPRHGIFGFDREADVTSVQMLSTALLDRRVPADEAERIALALHYAYGCAAGVFYVLVANRSSAVRTGQGTAFGTLLWLLGDELPISISGISNPLKKSPASHASAFAVHLLFGAVLESIAFGTCAKSFPFQRRQVMKSTSRPASVAQIKAGEYPA